MMDEGEAEYMAFVDALMTASRSLTGLGAGIVAAAALEIASDSRTFRGCWVLLTRWCSGKFQCSDRTTVISRSDSAIRAHNAHVMN